MAADTDEHDLSLSRRKLLAAAGLYGAGAASSLMSVGSAKAAPAAGDQNAIPAAPPVSGLHLQFGSEASSDVTVSWHTLQPVQNPRVLVGTPDGKLDRTVPAKPAGYTDAKSKQPVYAYHAKIADLKPDTAYLYCALHDGAAPEFGTFRTAPRGRVAFTFTSFGDQGTPTLGKKFVLPPTLAMANAPAGMPLFVNDNLGGPVYVTERAPWSAVRNAAHSYGFAAFTVDPGVQAGDATTIKVTYYDVMAPGGQISPFESFTLRRPRRD